MEIKADNNIIATEYSAHFHLPSSLSPGEYNISFSNDIAPSIYTPFDTFLNSSVPLWRTIHIRPAREFPQNEVYVSTANMNRACFNVSLLNPPKTWRCASSAITAALTSAKEKGGGIVYLPRGV